jgi:hypothetical protein|tara:strand:- start:281704 stop:281898 length:195 start_codon:yes stop_codon:yes gene_type:complete
VRHHYVRHPDERPVDVHLVGVCLRSVHLTYVYPFNKVIFIERKLRQALKKASVSLAFQENPFKK